MLSHDDMHIRFHSKGVVDILSVTSPLYSPYIGRDIFRLIGDCAISPPRNFKTDIRKALASGNAISVTLRLPAVRATAHEAPGEIKCVTHWTPLKDERSNVRWVVMTLAS